MSIVTFTLNDKRVLNYDPHTSRLTENDFDLFPIRIPDSEDDPFKIIPYKNYDNVPDAIAISPTNPGIKTSAPERLKISLGLGCNYTCSYCLQATHVNDAKATSTLDADKFLKNLDIWLDGSNLKKIEFWGGEPFLYWHKIKVLAPALKEKFPQVRFGTVSNGSLLTKEIIDELADWGFGMAVSHDGPGQHLRGPDPFEEQSDFAEILHYAREKLTNFSINAVITPVHADPQAVIDWFGEKGFVGCVNFEGVVHDYGGENAKFPREVLPYFTVMLVDRLMSGLGTQVPMFRSKIEEAMSSIANRRPSRILGQKCGMDKPDELAVDLKGNVTTCQNVGPKGKHHLGHVSRLDKVKLASSHHWSTRKECPTCPVLQLCKGACMYQEGEQFASSCDAEFAYNLAFLVVAIQLLTNSVVDHISFPDAIRPER